MADDRTSRFVHATLLVATPWVQLATNRNAFLTPAGNSFIDPWLYTGFFVSLPRYLRRFPDTYYGSRLTWLLPGFVAHSAFRPLIANYVVHLSFLYGLIAATYVLVSTGLSRRAALLVTLVVAWNPLIVGAFSWDYPDEAGIVFIVTTLMCLERSAAARQAGGGWLVAAGASLACMAISNLFLVTFWPLALLYLFLRLRAKALDLSLVVSMTSAIALGAFLTLGAFAIVSVLLGGDWWFLAPQLRTGGDLLRMTNPWRVPGYSWLLRATWLVVPAIAATAAVISCTRFRVPPFARTMQVVFLCAVCWWVTVEALGTPVVQLAYYTSYLAPLALIAVAVHAGAPDAGFTRATSLLASLLTFGVFAWAHSRVAAYATTFWQPLQPWVDRGLSHLGLNMTGSYQNLATNMTCLSLVAGVFAMIALETAREGPIRWLLFAAGLALSFAAVPLMYPLKTAADARTYYKETIAVHRFISDNVGDRKLRIWCGHPELPPPVVGIASTFLWEYSLLNCDMPHLTQQDAAKLTPATRLVLLLPTLDQAETARVQLRQFGYDFDVLSHREFGTGAMALSVVVTALR